MRCADGGPELCGSRAFRRGESRYGPQEADHRDLGRLQVGEAGELRREGSAVYLVALEFDDAAGGRRQAQAHLCRWRRAERTFETKFNALVVGLEEGAEREQRVMDSALGQIHKLNSISTAAFEESPLFVIIQ